MKDERYIYLVEYDAIVGHPYYDHASYHYFTTHIEANNFRYDSPRPVNNGKVFRLLVEVIETERLE